MTDEFSDLDVASIVAQLNDAVAADQPAPEADEHQLQPDPVSPAKVETPAPAVKEEAKPDPQDVRIPKARLDSEIAKKRAIETQLRETRQELEALKQARQRQDPQARTAEGETPDDLRAKLQELEQWRGQLEFKQEVDRANQDLKTEIAQIKAEHPNLDPQQLYAAVVQNPEVDLWAVAEAIAKYEQGIEARALERFQSTQPPAKAQRPAPIPRPGQAPSPSHGRQDQQRRKPEDMSWDELEAYATEELNQLQRG